MIFTLSDELTNVIGDVENLKDTGTRTKLDAKDVKNYLVQVLAETIENCIKYNALFMLYSFCFIVVYQCNDDSDCTSGHCVDGWCNSAFDHGKKRKTCVSSFILRFILVFG